MEKKTGIVDRVNKYSDLGFKQYKRKSISEMRPYQEGEILDSKVSISEADKQNGSPKLGDMIARNPLNHNDQWLVAEKYFNDNLEAFSPSTDNSEVSDEEIINNSLEHFNRLSEPDKDEDRWIEVRNAEWILRDAITSMRSKLKSQWVSVEYVEGFLKWRNEKTGTDGHGSYKFICDGVVYFFTNETAFDYYKKEVNPPLPESPIK